MSRYYLHNGKIKHLEFFKATLFCNIAESGMYHLPENQQHILEIWNSEAKILENLFKVERYGKYTG